MEKYDPQIDPNPEDWIALDEQERIALVEAWHRKAKVKLPNRRLHATFHVMVENQLAHGDECVQEAFSRLQKEGLDRHDALHAIASVIAEHMHDLMTGEPPAADSDSAYYRRVKNLTAKKWLDG